MCSHCVAWNTASKLVRWKWDLKSDYCLALWIHILYSIQVDIVNVRSDFSEQPFLFLVFAFWPETNWPQQNFLWLSDTILLVFLHFCNFIAVFFSMILHFCKLCKPIIAIVLWLAMLEKQGKPNLSVQNILDPPGTTTHSLWASLNSHNQSERSNTWAKLHVVCRSEHTETECGPSTALPNQPRRPQPFSRQPSTCLAVFTHAD